MKQIKPDVRLYGTRPEMVECDAVVASVFAKHGYDCTTTSAIGKKHKVGSLHPVGFAKDYRSKHLADTQMKCKILAEMQSALPMCDIMLEHLGEPQEHYHVEFDDHADVQFQEDKLYYKRTGKWPFR